MTVMIVSSTEDPASSNIKQDLLDQSTWDEIDTFSGHPVYQHRTMENVVIVTINDRTTQHEHLDKEVQKEIGITPRQAIFISRHRSKSGEPSLTTHPVGNYGDARFGGKEKTLLKSSPRLMTHLLRVIKQNAKKAKVHHQVCFEVSHHGPYIDIPTLFTEVGSTEKEWNKKKPAAIIAQSVLEVLDVYRYEDDMPKDIPVLLGIGGGHYAPRFTDVALEKKVAFGHMIPTYQIKEGNINEEMLEKAMQSTPDIAGVYFHRKAMKKSQVSRYKAWCEDKDIRVFSSKELPDLSS